MVLGGCLINHRPIEHIELNHIS